MGMLPMGMLTRLLKKRNPRLAVMINYGGFATELLREMLADTEAAKARRAQISAMPDMAVAQLLGLSLIARQVGEQKVQSWDDISWDDVLPLDRSSPVFEALIRPLTKLSGPVGSEDDMMRSLMAASDEFDLVEFGMDYFMPSKDGQQDSVSPVKVAEAPKKRRRFS